MKFSDGMIKDLENVKHMPELKKNLISLGMLDKMGCLVNCDYEKCNV